MITIAVIVERRLNYVLKNRQNKEPDYFYNPFDPGDMSKKPANLRELINDATLLRNLQLEELHFMFLMDMTQVCQGAWTL